MTNSVVKPLEIRAYPPELERRNTLVAELEEIVKSAKTERRHLTNKEENRFEEIKKEINEIDKKMQDKLASNFESRGYSANEEEEIRAFVDYVRTGEMRDLASANNGAVIPVSIANKITDKVFEVSALVESATIYTVGEDLNLPVYDYSAHVTAFITEFTEIVTSGGTFASVPMKSKIVGTLSKLGKSLVNRTSLDVLPFIIDVCGKSVARFLENEIITNANNRFASTLANGVTQTVTAGTAGAITPADLVAIKNSIPSLMLNGAKWLMHKDTLSYLQSLTDANGNLLFGNNLSEASANTLLGYEVMVSDAMPTMAAGARQIYFGNFKEGLAIKIGAQSAEVYKELYASQYALGIGSFIECDCSASHSTQAISVLVGA